MKSHVLKAWSSLCLSVILSLSLLNNVEADCPMPDSDFAGGDILYMKDADFNLTFAPDKYLLRFQCHEGFKRSGAQFLLCEENQWTSELPRCLDLECDNPPLIFHGYIAEEESSRHRVLGSTINYECSEGYELKNSSVTSITCNLYNNTVRWTDLPSCIERKSCPDPGVSLEGVKTGRCCQVGSSVSYMCNPGFERIGRRRITCLDGGTWSHKRPLCKPLQGHCQKPPPITNGEITGLSGVMADYFTIYDEVEIVCDPGYAFYGISEYVMCTEELEWDIPFGECTETTCSVPESIENGTLLELEGTNRTEFPHKFEVSYVCDQGYQLMGNTYRSCDRGNWTGNAPTCKEIKCPTPGFPENGNRNGNDFRIGMKVVFSCFQGFTLIGSPERYCMPNGQWSGELTRCDLTSNHCPDPGIPINGIKMGNSYQDGDKVRFRCYSKFTLVGASERVCQPDGTWSGEEAKCLGAHDFDNSAEVSETLKIHVNEKVDEQVAELVSYNSSLKFITSNATGNALQSKRILDLNYPGRMIFYFVFDTSGSVRQSNFKISINFAKALVKRIGITEMGARAGAFTFSSKARVEFHPVQYDNTEDVLEALDKIPYSKGGTATNSALRLVRTNSIPLTAGNLGKKGLKHVIFILTDGKANTGGSPEEEAELLKEKNRAEIYCIGITGDVMANALYRIASTPTHEHVFVLNNYKILEWLVQEITNGTIDYSECGLGLEKVGRQEQRIIGGAKAIDPWPWMAALYMTDRRPEDAELSCGGSIINKRWILTAAHCVCREDQTILRSVHEIIVKLGLTDVNNASHLQEFEPAHFYFHDGYNPSNLDNDIALILLNGIIEYNPFVRPICLPPPVIPENSSLYKVNDNAFATGWGHEERVKHRQKVPTKSVANLKELRLPLQSQERCLSSLLNTGGTENMYTRSMICAGTGDGKEDTCTGDSGGPLMQSQMRGDGNIVWTQIGITSWGMGCGQPSSYGYYTNVHYNLLWIRDITRNREE